MKDFEALVIEDLKYLGHKAKQDKKLNKTVRRSIGACNLRLWLERLELLAEENCVRLWCVEPQFTSQRCRNCNHTCRGNRSGIKFKCQECVYSGNADTLAAENILERIAMGAYGPQFEGIWYS